MSKKMMCLECGRISDQSRCEIHRKTTNLGYGSEHQKLRKAYIEAHPYCFNCECPIWKCKLELHHVTPQYGGRNPESDDRRQLLCKKCHDLVKEV